MDGRKTQEQHTDGKRRRRNWTLYQGRDPQKITVIVDTNILFSAILKNARTRNMLLHGACAYFTIAFSWEELEKYRPLLLRKTGLTYEELDTLLFTLFEATTIIPNDVIRLHLPQALSIMKDIDPNDAPFIAAAFAIEHDGIWSDDKHFQQQDVVKIWTTEELIQRVKHA